MLKPRASHAARKSLRFESLEDRRLLAGLVSWWTGNNTAADAVGANHGKLVSGATYAPGHIGQAFNLDGINDRVLVADSASLKLTASLTIEAWVRVDTLPTTGHGEIFFRGDDRGGLDPYSIAVEPNGNLSFLVSDLGGGLQIETPAPIGQFFHVAATLDDATGAMRLYVNGVLKTQAVTGIRPFRDLDPASNPSIGIGNHGGWPTTPHNFPFDGLIDELKIYDIALSDQQVLANFNAAKGALLPNIIVNNASITEGETPVSYLGNLVDSSATLSSPYKMIYGPDGLLYVSTMGGSVLRYDGAGAPLPAPGKTGADFVSPGVDGLDVARSIAFGPDGNLYVASQNSDAVLRFSGTTGEPLGALVPSGSGGLDQPRGLLFHTDGYLYVTSVGGETAAPGKDSVLRFHAVTGAPAGISGVPGDARFIATGSGGLDNPSKIVFENGSFYVASTSPSTSNSVLRFATNGAFLGAFVPTGSGGLAGPADIAFRDGYLYVASWTNNKVLRYNASTGAFVDEFASGNGLVNPLGLLFESNGNLLVTSRDTNEIRRYGESSNAVFTVKLSAPFPTPVSVAYATANGAATGGSDFIAASGTIIFAPGQTSRTILVRTLDDAVYETNETFVVNLSNPVGAVIADGQGVGTIVDNDLPPTKFYVVNDATANRTYEYGAGGQAVENYALDSGNGAPRGAASTAAGDKVWVVDANRKVYVYNAAGALLGSWTAGTLASNAEPEGIATNGTDVWIVDAKSDKVFKYAGAATRLSGSQNAASSFSLNSGNTSPKDIVTDGSSLWVVNDASTDKVFKYTTSGSLQGSWTISGAGSQPTGLTIDPTNVSSIWIVDAGTDRVYEFANAAARTSGSQSAAILWTLAAGNSNPQGIADPIGIVPLLAGAFDGSGKKVDAADLHVWRASFGQTVSAGSAADGNENGLIDGGAYLLWQNNLGATLTSTLTATAGTDEASATPTAPIRNYMPSRRSVHSAMPTPPTSTSLDIHTRTNPAQQALRTGKLRPAQDMFAETAAVDAALEELLCSERTERLAEF